MKLKVLAVVNQKGGVGKTSLSLNLCHYLRNKNVNVLAIDLDPQSSLTLSLLGREIDENEKSIIEFLLNGEVVAIKTNMGFDLLPSCLSLATIEPRLISAIGREFKLKKSLSRISADMYDIVIIDTPPNLGILTINALIASDGVIVPVETKYYGLMGLKHLFTIFKEIENHLDKKINVVGIVPNIYEKQITIQKEALLEIQKLPYKIFSSIPKRSAFQYSAVSGLSVNQEGIDMETNSVLEEISKEVINWLKER